VVDVTVVVDLIHCVFPYISSTQPSLYTLQIHTSTYIVHVFRSGTEDVRDAPRANVEPKRESASAAAPEGPFDRARTKLRQRGRSRRVALQAKLRAAMQAKNRWCWSGIFSHKTSRAAGNSASTKPGSSATANVEGGSGAVVPTPPFRLFESRSNERSRYSLIRIQRIGLKWMLL
jgi:hypothetical protein